MEAGNSTKFIFNLATNCPRRIVRDELSCDELSATSCPQRIVLRRIVPEPSSSAISPRKKKGLKKAWSRGQRARKNLSTGFYRETIPQERTSSSKSTLLRCGRP